MSALFGNFAIEPLDLNRHWDGIERLIEIEEWPYIKADLELAAAQQKFIGLIVRIRDAIVGFFTAHDVANVAYVDMLIIDPAHRRNVVMANELWRTARGEMERKAFRAFVTHCLRPSAVIARWSGYQAGLGFTLLRREALTDRSPGDMAQLGADALDELISLDAHVFGATRSDWLTRLMAQPTTRFIGLHRGGQLRASVCLRERRDNALCLDSCNALAFDDLMQLLESVIETHPHKRLECFVRSDIDLQHYLEGKGFRQPDFFERTGPLVEYRLGDTGEVGLGTHVRSLSWI